MTSYRSIAASTRARRSWPASFCQPSLPRAAIRRMCLSREGLCPASSQSATVTWEGMLTRMSLPCVATTA